MYAIRSYYAVGEVRLVHDVTQERELEQLKDDFFSTISHELRTPLFSIQGFAQIMLEEKDLDQPTQKEFFRITSYNVCYTKLLRGGGG